MKKTKKILSLVLSVAMLTVIFAACADNSGGGSGGSGSVAQEVANLGAGQVKDIYNDPIKIAQISISTAGIINQLVQLSYREQLYRFPNVSVVHWDAEYDPNRQVTLIQEAVTQGYDAIVIEAMDPFALNGAIEEAEKAGIPVISVNAAEPQTVHTLYMAGADYSSGWASAELMVGMSGNEGTAIVLDCPPAMKPAARMGTGFEEYIQQKTNIRLIEQLGIENWSADNAQISMRDCLTKYGPGEITMVYCANDDIAMGAANAIDQAGRADEGIIVWGFNGFRNGLELVKEGKLAGTMFGDTYVQNATAFYFAMYAIATGLTGQTAGYTRTPVVEQPMLPVTQQNIDDVMAVSRWFVSYN
ncbi:MAG: sugar ABC transporter substrate-binding protein [Oscillospiraceae bacterium]|nr:sugar ABC transporter substrate-binding protein [Oscillospiraceae bacterium]